ncbi:MAG: VWA domain-containing protein [Nitrospinae bacterium]|nr:VWA domain-containing protein [Nitrospinota bacterium]
MKKNSLLKIFLCLFIIFIASSNIYADDKVFLDIVDIQSKKDKVNMIISAIDDKNIQIGNIEKNNLRVYVDDKQINSFELEPIKNNSLSVILLLDISGSMKGQFFFKTKQGIQFLLNKLDASDYVSLVVFGDTVKTLTPFTQNKEIIEKAMDTIEASDKTTKLYQAIYQGLYMVSLSYTPRTVIILFTDGKDEGSLVTKKELISRLNNFHIPIYTVGFSNNIEEDFLRQIASISDGEFLPSPSFDNFKQLANSTIDKKNSSFKLEFGFPNPTGKYVATIKFLYNNEEVKAAKSFSIHKDDKIQTQKNTTDYTSLIKQINSDIVKPLLKQYFLLTLLFIFIIATFLLLLFKQKTKLHNKIEHGLLIINSEIEILKKNAVCEKIEKFDDLLQITDDRIVGLENYIKQLGYTVDTIKTDTQGGFDTFSNVIRDILTTYIEGNMEQSLHSLNNDIQILKEKIGDAFIEKLNSYIAMAINKVEIDIKGINKQMLTFKNMSSKDSLEKLQGTINNITDDIKYDVNSLNSEIKALKSTIIEQSINNINSAILTTTQKIDALKDIIVKNNDVIRLDTEQIFSTFLETIKSNFADYIEKRIQYGFTVLSKDVHGFNEKIGDGLAECIHSSFEKSEQRLEQSIENINKQIELLKSNSSHIDSIDSVINISLKDVIKRIENSIKDINQDIQYLKNDVNINEILIKINNYIDNIDQSSDEKFRIFIKQIQGIRDSIDIFFDDNKNMLLSINNTVINIQQKNNAIEQDLRSAFQDIAFLKDAITDIMRFLVILSKKI